MAIELHILGCAAATPRIDANPTAQVLNISERLFLIDCAEGTQVALRKNRIKFTRINHIFISHLHGDHFFGLVGLISSFHLLDRKTPLTIFGPKGLEDIIRLQLRCSQTQLKFDLHFVALTSKSQELIFEDDKVAVYTVPLKHRIYTNGFLFKEKPGPRKINKEACDVHGLEVCDYHNLKRGRDYIAEDGEVIENEILTCDPPRAVSYAFCSDTKYFEGLADLIQGVDLLYHEATFLNDDVRTAKRTYHSTAGQAAQIAKLAGAKQLILGHFSTRYKQLDAFLSDAQEVFGNVSLARDGKVFHFKSE